MASNPVVVYGASGYTGALTCEFLTQFGVPFTAAGRDRARLSAVMQKLPGVETAQYDIAEVAHEVDALAKVFSGAKVVCNVVGPFSSLGDIVVEAALKAGCHYIDTTGEQAHVILAREEFGAAYAKRGLLLAPSTAYMHAVLEIAARACISHGEVDTLEGVCAPTGTPTFASTQTIFQSVRAKEFYLEGGALKPWPAAHAAEVSVPFTDRTLLALPWSGTAVPIWFQDDPRIRNVKVMTAFSDRNLMTQVHGIYQHYHANLAKLPEDQQQAELAKIAASIQPGMPPRENPLFHRNWDSVIGTSSLGRVRYTIYSHCPYQQTGLLQAFAANWLLKAPPRAPGFQSPCAAFGADNLLGALERFGYARMAKEA
ncbi:MAG: hypothetical protein FD160_2433 [Caulobacteraceae bacterium]|nr:MAG: hypothetical protein FD160_2433 [Caulobacteraceae bacterium]